MKVFNKLNSILLVTVLFSFATLAQAAKEQLPEITEDGLHLLPDRKMAIVYADPEADLSQYNKIHLVEAYVAFKKNWERDQRLSTSSVSSRITSSDIEKIKASLAAEFYTIFKEELEKGGYELTDVAGDDVMIVRPAIINLDVNAPDTPHAGRSKTYTSSAGEMTLYVELIDSVTGDIFAKAVDRQYDDARGGFYTWTNSVTNKVAADRILRGWATILREALDEARKNPAE